MEWVIAVSILILAALALILVAQYLKEEEENANKPPTVSVPALAERVLNFTAQDPKSEHQSHAEDSPFQPMGPEPPSRSENQAVHPANSEAQARKIKIGTIVFGAFAALSLLVSVINGVVPIFLIEAAAWAVAAFYWQKKKSESEFAKGVLLSLAIVVAVGEIYQVATHDHTNALQNNPYLGTSSEGDPWQKVVPLGSTDSSSSYGSFWKNQSGSNQATPNGNAYLSQIQQMQNQQEDSKIIWLSLAAWLTLLAILIRVEWQIVKLRKELANMHLATDENSNSRKVAGPASN